MQLAPSKRPRDYLARREQWRLLVLVVALGVVLILASEARSPKRWTWLWAGSGPGDAEPAPPRTGVDNRLEVQPLGQEAAANVRIAQDRPGAVERPTEAAAGGAPSAGEGDGSPTAPPRREHISRDELAAIRDDSYFRNDEAKAWFALLDILRQTDEGELERRSLGRVAYVQLFRQPNTYRGELVTVVGTVRRAHRLSAPKNDVGIERYYQLWLQPADNPSSPMVIYCLGLPEGFPTGMGLAEDVRITGFFFKRWAYRAADTLRTAPTLLAKTVVWSPAATMPADVPPDPSNLPWIVAAALLLSGLVVGYVYYRTRPTPRGPGEPSPDFAMISATGEKHPTDRPEA